MKEYWVTPPGFGLRVNVKRESYGLERGMDRNGFKNFRPL